MSTVQQGIDIVVGTRGTQQAGAALGVLNGFVQGIGMAVANYAGRAARALGEMTGEALHTADEMGKLAQKTGAATESISAIAYAAKLSDVGLGELQVGIKGLSQWMEKQGLVGRDVIEVMLEQSDVLAGMADGAAKTNLAMELFGRSGQELIPLLNQGSEAIRKQMEEAKRYGLVISGDFARGAEVFNDRLTTMKSRLEGVSIEITTHLLPGLLKLTDTMMATADTGGPMLDVFKSIAGWLMDQFTAQVSRATEVLVTLAGGTVGFFKALAEGQSLSAAAGQAVTAAAKAYADYSEALEKHRREREESNDEDKKTIATIPKLTTAYESLGMELKNIQLLTENATGAQRAAGLQMQLQLLDRMAETAGEAAQFAGDGSMLYTEEGLRAAERLLEIERTRAAVLRELTELTKSDWTRLMEELNDQNTNFAANFMQVIADINYDLGRIVGDVITRAQTMGQAWASAGRQAISAISNMVSTYVAGKLAMMVIDKIYGKQKVAENAAATASALPAGIAQAGAQGGWVGILLYMAVFAAAIAAISAMTSAVSGGFAEGGLVNGPGTGTSDSILSRLSNGEFVMTAAATQAIGPDALAQANRDGRLPSDGGGGVGVNLAFFGGESAAQRWAESQEGHTWFVDMFRQEAGRL